VFVERPSAACPFLLIGDHAGRSIPRRLGALGLGQADLERHIAWDIGVEATGLRLAAELEACFIHQAYSRLVIDCNRAPGSAASIPLVSDGTPILGNAGLSKADIADRVGTIYEPYQARIAQELDERRSRNVSTILVALHSFTPCLDGLDRPWRYGVLHRHDSPFSASFLRAMSVAIGPEVGDNHPYAMDETDNTVPLHRAGRDIDYLELEVRQDLIADAAGQAKIAREIAHFLVKAQNDMVGP
jgi:predicted N-formylglutamate amidohydrolase